MNPRIEKLLEYHRQSPEDDFAPYALAIEYLSLGDGAQALEWIARTLAIRPDHAYAYYQKARAHQLDDRVEEARRAIEEGLAAAQRSGDARAQAELRELAESLE